MKRIIARVTQENIDNGTPKDKASCPIALAIKRDYQPYHCVVGACAVCFTKGQTDEGTPIVDQARGTFHFGYKAVEFVQNFDRGIPVKPTTFHFDKWQ